MSKNTKKKVKTKTFEDYDLEQKVIIRLQDPEGKVLQNTFELPLKTEITELQELLNAALENDEPLPYSFTYNGLEIKTSLREFLSTIKEFSAEKEFPLVYFPQSLYKVRPITRWSSSLEGHTEAVLATAFSPNSQHLASGSGDTTVRLWDLNTETPLRDCKGHKNWVLVIAWSPNSQWIASGDMNGSVMVWDPFTGNQIAKPSQHHKKWVTSLAWEPLHLNSSCSLLASSSKDGTLKLWEIPQGVVIRTLALHTSCVTKLIFTGEGTIISASEDRTIKLWKKSGELVKELKGHGHWVNCLALSTDYAMRTSGYNLENPAETESLTDKKLSQLAKVKYEKAKGSGERLVSGSDDNSLIIWDLDTLKEKRKLTGHQQPVNHVNYSPDARFIVSASFDKSLKIWNGFNGDFLGTLRGHVAAVYQVSWSSDSRMLVSASKDTTLKVWDSSTKKLMFDLPGHSDEVYAVDWSPNGDKVVSGGKDRLLKIWRN